VVDANDCGYTQPSIALDTAGNPRISYHDQTNVTLKFASWNGSSWDLGTVDANGQNSSLEFDRSGAAAISYQGYSTCPPEPNTTCTVMSLNYARWNGSIWDVEVVVPPFNCPGWAACSRVGQDTSLAFDSNDDPGIAWASSNPGYSGHYAKWTGSDWEHFNFEGPDTAFDIALVLDSADRLHVAHHAQDFRLSVFGVIHSTWNGTDGDSEVIDEDGGGQISLAIDTNDGLFLSYTAATALRYAHWDGATWSVEDVDTDIDPSGGNTSLGFDGAGRPAIAYVDGTVKVAWWDGSSWQIHDIDVGAVTSLAVDGAGTPAVALAARNGDLRFASWNGLAFDVEMVDDGIDPSLAFDPGGRPAIAYENDELKLARWNGATWDIEIVDDGSGVRPSLAFAPDGQPAISSIANASLRYSKWNGAAWETASVPDAGARDFAFTSLAFDPAGEPAISYMGRDYDVRYARWNGRRWRVEVVDENRVNTWLNSLVFDGNGDPLISYDLGCSESLQLARRQEVSSIVYRGAVTDLTVGWKSMSLPLDAAHDDETAPFPIDTVVGAFTDDTLASPAPLTLYRLLIDGTQPAGNVLRVVESPGAIAIHY